ncbi:MAG: redoxin domain-containing protein [Chlorobi bacterium]|nr:redoxin domain-containing protein [Chlorobiota bacterium]
MNYSIRIISGLLFSILLLFGSPSLFSQTATITGQAEGKPHELVRVIIYADQFSKLPETLASTYTDENGNFELTPQIKQTDYAFLAVGLKKGEFYLKPGAEYQFMIPKDTIDKRGSVFDEMPLRFSLKADDGGLNDEIGNFNVAYNTFIYENGNKIYRGYNKQFISDFIEKVDEAYDSVGDEYIRNYVRYSMISLQWVAKMMSSDSVISTWFVNQPVLYHNIQYTEFFSELFQSYFGYQRIFSYSELVDAINNGKGYQAVDELLKRQEDLTADNRLRELIGIFLISKKYFSADVIRDNVIALLREIQQNSKYPENSNVAGNYIVKLQKLEPGTAAPSFSLKDASGKTVSLKELSDKVLLLAFIRSDCKVCLQQMGDLEALRKKFGNKLKMATLVYGKQFQEVVQYAADRNFNWPVLDIGDNILLLEAYNIRAYPTYVIIKPGGMMGMATAPMPDENLDLFIRRYVNEAEKANNAGEH